MEDQKKRIDALSEKYRELTESLKIPEKKVQLKELEILTQDSELWNNPENARGVMQKFADANKEIIEVETLGSEIATLNELFKIDNGSEDLVKETYRLEKQLEKLTLTSFLSGEYDIKNAIVSIHAGQGGTEAMDWTGMLYRMYLRFCEKRGWATNTVDYTAGEEAGIKSVTFNVQGRYAYGYLKNEAGTHRLVRQSPFNADKLRQTSFALVEVLPEFEAMDLPNIQIKDEDIELQFFHSSSKGGQNVQKVSTAVRIIHKPTGIVVTAQSERFQEQNRKNALDILRAKLWLLEKERAKQEKKDIKGEYRPASWGTQIRSYVLHPYKMVKDLRTEVESGNPDAVLDGDLDMFIESELKKINLTG